MKVPLSWLSEWIDLPHDRSQLFERLTLAGLEIEEISEVGPDLSELKVGFVVSRDAHPNADRLALCGVEIGEDTPLEIVCGAPNVKVGQKVVVATHGTKLPNGIKIKRSKIRGVTSNGMICSARELDLGDDHSGIIELDPDVKIGESVSDVLGARDDVIDVSITPNRGDWLSMLGMAREIRTHFGGSVRVPEFKATGGGRAVSDSIRVSVSDVNGCSIYLGRVVRGIHVGESPKWLVDRLELAGLRSINNVVDVTNYVMLELGQPIHAFDLRTLSGDLIEVRKAVSGEQVVTLDNIDRRLTTEDLVIADGERIVGIAGVMGAKCSEVKDETSDIFIEAADFDPSRIRRTARRLGLSTDASYRFERGIDSSNLGFSIDRVASLVQEIAGGELSSDRVEIQGASKQGEKEVLLSPEYVNKLLGISISEIEMRELLERVDISIQKKGDKLACTPPQYRSDITIAEDLIEEIARVYGYDKIPVTLPSGSLSGVSHPQNRDLCTVARDTLMSAGLVEVVTFSAGRTEDLEALRIAHGDSRRNTVEIENPIQADESVLRSSLVPSMLRTASLNFSRQQDQVAIFEISRVFISKGKDSLPEELLECVLLFGGESSSCLWTAEAPIFFKAKGIVERVLEAFRLELEFVAGSHEPFLHPGASGAYRLGSQVLVNVGELHPSTAKKFKLEGPIAIACFALQDMGKIKKPTQEYCHVSRYPRVRRDLSVLISKDVASDELIRATRQVAGKLLNTIRVYDRYEGDAVPKDKISLTLRLVFQHNDRTLTDSEVNKACGRVIDKIAATFGGELRSSSEGIK